MAWLRCFRGIDTVTAVTIVSELQAEYLAVVGEQIKGADAGEVEVTV